MRSPWVETRRVISWWLVINVWSILLIRSSMNRRTLRFFYISSDHWWRSVNSLFLRSILIFCLCKAYLTIYPIYSYANSLIVHIWVLVLQHVCHSVIKMTWSLLLLIQWRKSYDLYHFLNCRLLYPGVLKVMNCAAKKSSFFIILMEVLSKNSWILSSLIDSRQIPCRFLDDWKSVLLEIHQRIRIEIKGIHSLSVLYVELDYVDEKTHLSAEMIL